LRRWYAAALPGTLFGMNTEATAQDAIRHLLLEGVLLRLAQRHDVNEFVLRGGMLMRHWFHPHPRPAGDLDLVATFPFDVEEAARRFVPLLALEIDDGATLDLEQTRVEGIWLETGNPGVRVFTTGVAEGVEVDFNVDITFGPQPRPAPVFTTLPTTSGNTANVWACRPETIVGQKMQALQHLGMLGWRAKDLNDLRLLLALVPLNNADLRGAIAAYMADLGRTLDDARTLLGESSWWGMKLSSARWHDFAKSSPGQSVPRDLANVVAEIVSRLAPALENSP